MIKRIAQAALALVVLLALVLAVNTLRHGSRQLQVEPVAGVQVDVERVASHLAAAVRLRTISSLDDATLNADQFEQLHALLQDQYPAAHKVLKREVVNGLSLLYTWPGSDPALAPIALMAHQDVVPIAPGTEPAWQQPPFDGVQADGFVWGRGAWDDKGNLIAQMEAVEMLAASGWQPKRTVYLVFGADEEVGGQRGAFEVAQLLKSRGVKLDFVIDEGLLITEGVMPGLAAPAALIGIAEKGYLSVAMKTSATPGHSSMPPPAGDSAIAMMSAVLNHLESHQMPAAMRGVAQEMFDTVAPEMSGFSRVALSNLWLFGPVVQRQLEAKASTNAMLRTTTALTIVNAGNKDNVLPGQAEATVNFRILPGDSQAGVLDHVHQAVEAVADTKKVDISTLPFSSEPSPISVTAAPSYQLINRTVRELFPGTLVAPGLMIGATDSRHFLGLSDHIYRFSPVRAKPEDLARFHGTNERVSTANLAEMVRFYHRLLEQSSAPQAPVTH